ncbi:hypothetical protein LV716_07515 [Flagellimonas sp. HMM57]|uniref:hypothetical protein n=1 Tax=unclassified Flagellimonas TaxID=2644544 RepID=UPI0013D8444A|nr:MULTISPECIES: hypothetical protein [unclassified Flagellimonas]UII77607.1 hypothetical protein LV716_07515 [Flagellimonas sp. HMM57]
MADQPVNSNSSDEIDLGQLFQLIGKGFNKIGLAFLKLFLYLKKHALILGGLIIIGLAAGYGLNQVTEKKMKIEVIVKPNLESKDYLYNVVEEIENNLRAENFQFFTRIGIDTSSLREFKIAISPMEEEENAEENLAYLELLGKFQGNEDFSDVIKSELLNRSEPSHMITFLFKDIDKGRVFAEKVMQYINANTYLRDLTEVAKQNALDRIEKNEIFVDQIDILISAYTKSLESEGEQIKNQRITFSAEEKTEITGLFELKNQLIYDIELKKIALKEQKDPINIINFGSSQQVKKAFFGRSVILIPSLLLLLFLGISALIAINKRASNLTT